MQEPFNKALEQSFATRLQKQKTNLYKLKVSNFKVCFKAKEAELKRSISKKGPTSELPGGAFAPLSPRQLRHCVLVDCCAVRFNF